jgi:CheY-like chemotaxis protein
MRWLSLNRVSNALDLFRRDTQAFDLILTDLSMPLMDGEETFERLRQMSPTVNVVLMAGFVDSGRLEKMMNNGLSGFVGKPFAPVEILAVVTSVISAADQSRKARAVSPLLFEKTDDFRARKRFCAVVSKPPL